MIIIRICCLFVTTFFALTTYCQISNCSNIDFEEGDLNNWTTTGNVEIVNANQVDPYGGFPLALSGYNGVKLGNKLNTVTTAPFYSSVSKTLTITNQNRYFIYGFAIVLLGYPHSEEDASYVKLEVTDENGDTLDCTQYIVYAQSSVGNGFFQSTMPFESNLGSECCFPIYYKPWEINALDLNQYVGQTLTFNLISQWCVYDVDWGYAYVDAYCSENLLNQYISCEDQLYHLSTVDGLSPYQWSGPGIVSGQGTSDIQINQEGTYTLDIPSPNSQCPPLTISYNASFDELPSYPIADFTTDFSVCLGDSITFYNMTITDAYISDVQWSFGDGDSSFLYKPTHLYDEVGNYEVELIIVNEHGCIDSVTHYINVVIPPEIDLGPNVTVCDGEKVVIESLISNENSSYSWSNGSTEESIEVNEEQEVILFLSNGCTVSDTILILEHAAYFGPIPNVITANDDEINDIFLINNFDLIEYKIVVINRWGEIVFESSDPTQYWNGKNKNKEVNEGVYFYKIEYLVSCSDKEKIKTGFVTVVK